MAFIASGNSEDCGLARDRRQEPRSSVLLLVGGSERMLLALLLHHVTTQGLHQVSLLLRQPEALGAVEGRHRVTLGLLPPVAIVVEDGPSDGVWKPSDAARAVTDDGVEVMNLIEVAGFDLPSVL